MNLTLGAPEAVDEMESEKYLPELMAEKDTLDPSFQHSLRLLEQGKGAGGGGGKSVVK